MSSAPAPSPPQRPGRLVSLLLDLSTREVEVQRVEAVSERLRWITLAGEQLRGAQWAPGDMLQILLSGSTLLGPWEMRSYTPLAFDAAAGTVQILGYVHGAAPGADWFSSVGVGARCRVVGPRFALALSKVTRPMVFFGDETSLGTALALRETPSGARDVRFVFEVNAVEEARALLARCGLGEAVTFVARQDGDRHLDELERELLGAHRAARAARTILTGKASSIQRLYKALRAGGVPARQVTNLAYWAEGKKGL